MPYSDITVALNRKKRICSKKTSFPSFEGGNNRQGKPVLGSVTPLYKQKGWLFVPIKPLFGRNRVDQMHFASADKGMDATGIHFDSMVKGNVSTVKGIESMFKGNVSMAKGNVLKGSSNVSI